AGPLQLEFGARNPPRGGQGPERAAGSNAGTAGDHRRANVSPARSVPRSCNTKADRTGRHIPTARGATGSFHVQVEHWLSAKARGTKHPGFNGDLSAGPARGFGR